MTNKLLADCGEALYGERWQTALAFALGVSERTVRYWVAGKSEPKPGVWVDILDLMEKRAHALDDLTTRLKRATAP